ncbi:MAG: ABC transporter permease [Kiloniellaceae bacterium]
MRLERRETTSIALAALAPFAAVAAALLLCAALILWSGAPVLEAYAILFKGAFGSRLAVTETLARAAPLILTGLAAAVAFRAKLWNIGGEGQFYVGALIAAAAGSGAIVLPSLLLVPLVLALGAAGGALLLLGPAWLKTRLGVDEVVTTLLLNFVMLLFVSMMIEGPMKDPLAFGWPQSAPVLDEAVLPKLIARTRLHAGFLIALAMALVFWLIDARTVWGYQARAVGANPRAARFAGMPIGAVMLRAAVFSGGLAGLAGACEVTGLKGYLTLDLSPGFGYTGIVVAMLAQLSPPGVVGAAVFVAAVFVGADAMGRAVNVPSFIADVIVAVSLLSMLIAVLMTRYRIRR